jgi:hypothetical protein
MRPGTPNPPKIDAATNAVVRSRSGLGARPDAWLRLLAMLRRRWVGSRMVTLGLALTLAFARLRHRRRLQRPWRRASCSLRA